MFRMLIDTCVWLDLAKDTKHASVLDALEQLIRLDMVDLIVPRVIIDEFQRNRERIAKESAKSLAAHFQPVRDAISKMGGDDKRTQMVLSHLDDVNHKIPIVGGGAVATLDRIEKLLNSATPLEICDAVRLRASQRALEKKAPFHHGKNAMADAILIETYADFVKSKAATGLRFAFVTHNKRDFSTESGNHRIPHPDFAGIFSRIKSLYFINLVEALRRIAPSLVTDIMLENSWTQEPRGLTEILGAEDLLHHQVWYDRHWGLRIGVQEGRIKVVDNETYPRPVGSQTVERNIWKGALKSARRVERQYGKKNLGPWSDFEWGMINGKLSALRWVLGDDWDMLDT